MPRVTRATIRKGKVHEDEETTPPAEETQPLPETPKPALKDITNQSVSTPVGAAKLPKFELQVQKTPRFDPDVHREVSAAGEDVGEPEPEKDDSFVEHIITRTPSRPAMEMEDLVQPMDAPTEAGEPTKVSVVDTCDSEVPSKETQPNIAAKTTGPAKQGPSAQKPSETRLKVEKKTHHPSRPVTTKPSTTGPTKRPSVARKTSGKPTESRGPNTQAPKRLASTEKTPVKTSTARVSSVPSVRKPSSAKVSPLKAVGRPSTSKPLVPAEKRQPSLSNSATKQLPNTMQKRKPSGPLSTSKSGFVPAKSSKPPTTSSFVLPGEAVAAKLKAQREERQKKEDEPTEAKKTFKARPVPVMNKSNTLPRENKASRARLSAIMHNPTQPAGATSEKLKNNMVVAKTRTEPNKANSGVRRTTLNNRGTSIAKISSPKLSVEELQARAKKAREEAAERGRAASREWAEKQKKKVAAGASAKAPTEQAQPSDAVMA